MSWFSLLRRVAGFGAPLVVVACAGGPSDEPSGTDSATSPTAEPPTTSDPTTSDPTTSDPTTPSADGCPTALYAGTSCDTFLDGCFEPDTAGTCTDTPLRLEWSDGHVIDRNVARPTAGLIAPGETTPCIALAFEPSTSTSTLTKVATGEVLTNQDLGGGAIRITCPAGEVIEATAAETNADNVCRGLACPP